MLFGIELNRDYHLDFKWADTSNLHVYVSEKGPKPKISPRCCTLPYTLLLLQQGRLGSRRRPSQFGALSPSCSPYLHSSLGSFFQIPKYRIWNGMNCTPEVIDALPDIVRWLFTLRGNFEVFHSRSCGVMSSLSSLHSFLVI